MHQDNADIERAQYRHIQKNVGKVLVGNNSPIHADDEYLFSELRDVLEDPAEISEFHG